MREEVLKFIQSSSFPCIMAKAAARAGYMDIHSIPDISHKNHITEIQQKIYQFVNHFRKNLDKLSSFILLINDAPLRKFEAFESAFFHFLQELNYQDKLLYPHDPRVANDVNDGSFSYSLKSEAFFIIALHPESPRWARRFSQPAIVFNPHIQFEKLREKNLYQKIKNIIRTKDKLLQGSINPMLNDFGTRSEVFQYLGKIYGPHDKVPLTL